MSTVYSVTRLNNEIKDLLDAVPGYRNLLVRIAGYSAYFCDLSRDLQNDVIARTEHADM